MFAMPRINAIPGVTVLLAAAAIVGCEDSTTEPAEGLSREETEALYLGMQELATDTTPEVISVTPDGGVYACPLGGQVAATFQFSEETAADTVRLLTSITLDPEGCVLPSEGHEFTLDGNPDVTTEVNTAIVGSTFEFLVEGTVSGGLDWMLDDRSGTCMIDLTLAVDPAQPTSTTLSGTMCGQEVEFDAGGLVSAG